MYRVKIIFALFAVMIPFGICFAAQPLGCLFEPERVAEIGSPVIGIVASVNVERGDLVRKGQVLATLRSDVERASVDVAHTRAKAEADVRTAEANLKLARLTQQRSEELVSKKFISQQALDKAIADTDVAEQKLSLAREQLNVWSGELAVARAQLGQRLIRSPIDGIVADRYIWAGERVEDKALFKVAKIDPLRVEMVVPVALFGLLTPGMKIDVTPEMPNATMLQAEVVLVDKIIDGASNTFRIRAEIANKDMTIPSGLRCKANLPDPPKVANKNDPLGLLDPSTNSGKLKLTPQRPPVTPKAVEAPKAAISSSNLPK